MVGSTAALFPSMMTSVFSRKDGENDPRGIQETYLFAYRLTCHIGTFLSGIVLIFGSDFIPLWLGPGHDDIGVLLRIFMIGTFFSIIQAPGAVSLLYGTSRNRYYAMINATQAVLTIIASLLLIRPFGLVGVVAANSAVSLVMKTVFQPLCACRVLGMTLAEYHRRHTVRTWWSPFYFSPPSGRSSGHCPIRVFSSFHPPWE